MKFTSVVFAAIVGCALAIDVKPTKFGLECDVCTEIVKFAEKEIAGEGTNAQQELDKYCKRIPLFGSECVKLVDEYLPKIVQALKNGAEAGTVCTEVGLCTSQFALKVKQAEAAARVQLNGEFCYVCHLIAPAVEHLAGQEEPEILRELETVCRIAKFAHLEQACDSFIEAKGAALATALANDETNGATELCRAIGVCTSAAGDVERQQAIAQLKTIKGTAQSFDSVKCAICHYLGPKLEGLAAKEEPVVARDLETICKVVSFDKKWEGECDHYIETEGAHIATVLTNDQGSSGTELCVKIGWCAK